PDRHAPPAPHPGEGKRRGPRGRALPPGHHLRGRLDGAARVLRGLGGRAEVGARAHARTRPDRGRGGSCKGEVVGLPRFELGTSPTRTERATRLRHSPKDRRLALPYSGCVSERVRRAAVLGAAFIAVAGCTSGDDEDGSASAETTSPAVGPAPAQAPA